MFDYTAARFWWDVIITILLGANVVFTWITARTKVNTDEIKHTKDQLSAIREEMRSVDERLKAAIGHPELKPIYDRINNMDKQLGEINGKMHTLDLIHEFLMNHNGGNK